MLQSASEGRVEEGEGRDYVGINSDVRSHLHSSNIIAFNTFFKHIYYYIIIISLY